MEKRDSGYFSNTNESLPQIIRNKSNTEALPIEDVNNVIIKFYYQRNKLI